MPAADYANTVVQEQFPQGVTPLAQLIMLDAGHGDSNIIDICSENLNQNGQYASSSSWQRYLIDTGPDDATIRENLIRVIVSYKQPKGPGGDPALPPNQQPKLSMMQFTHTDEDHSGGGEEFLKALLREETLQRHFEDTSLAFHKLPVENPGFNLRFKQTDDPYTDAQAYPYTVTCIDTNWEGYRKGLENGDYNIHLHYSFTINNEEYPISPSPRILVPLAHIPAPGGRLTITCAVSMHSRRTVGRTNQMVEFKLREAHKKLFKVMRFWIVSADGQLGVARSYQVVVLPPGALAPTVARYDPVTRQQVPTDEKRRADQMYHRIAGGRAGVVKLDIERYWARNRLLLDHTTITPTQGQRFDHPLSTVQIVGPTRTIYNEFIGDSMRVEYDQGVVKQGVLEKAEQKDGVLHNMASIVTLFRRWAAATDKDAPGAEPALSMLFTGDAHDRECQVRDTIDSYAGALPTRAVDVLKVPHHGSLCSTSVEFYNRFAATVYLVCARQNNHGLPNLRILEAMVRHTARPGGATVHIFFSNPESLWNLRLKGTANGVHSNLNILLSGKHRPGANSGSSKYNYRCYILKHRVPVWRYDKSTKNKNAGIILLSRDAGNRLVVTADEKWWDIWDEERLNTFPDPTRPQDTLESYRRVKPEQ